MPVDQSPHAVADNTALVEFNALVSLTPQRFDGLRHKPLIVC
jgi:hypothetical protein